MAGEAMVSPLAVVTRHFGPERATAADARRSRGRNDHDGRPSVDQHSDRRPVDQSCGGILAPQIGLQRGFAICDPLRLGLRRRSGLSNRQRCGRGCDVRLGRREIGNPRQGCQRERNARQREEKGASYHRGPRRRCHPSSAPEPDVPGNRRRMGKIDRSNWIASGLRVLKDAG